MSGLNKIKAFVQHELILCIASLLAVISTIVIRPEPKVLLSAIDFRVLSLLFCLMLVIQGFRKINVLSRAAEFLLRRCSTLSSLYAAFILLVFLSSMVLTNDVALLTFVPLTLLVFSSIKMNAAPLVVLETAAANLGSCFTPMGNPQNLFLYSFYHFETSHFFYITAFIAFPSILLLAISIKIFSGKKVIPPLNSQKAAHIPKKLAVFYTAVLIVILLSVFRVLDWKISLIATCAAILVSDKSLFARADYCLLLTFSAFFIFTKNIAALPEFSAALQSLLKTEKAVYFAGIISSQVISNVPAALLLSGFTNQADALLLGVNAGGLGTLVASLASIISYKFYAAQNKNTASYFILFTVMNLIYLAVLIPLHLFFCFGNL